ncbi:hypothetical protein HS7_15410 [Sulfolobales archaeon HS-7]|nr:hypothetical protein HS7_15410 [Sulfolobales archaeon HS-7]
MIRYKSENRRKKGLENILGAIMLLLIVVVAAAFLGYYVFRLIGSHTENTGVRIISVSPLDYQGSAYYLIVGVQNTGGTNETITVREFAGSITGINSNSTSGVYKYGITPGAETLIWLSLGSGIPIGTTITVQASASTGANQAASGASESVSYTIQ